MEAVDPIETASGGLVRDLFVQSRPDPTQLCISAALGGVAANLLRDGVRLRILSPDPSTIIWEALATSLQSNRAGEARLREMIAIPDARLWAPGAPHIYRLQVLLGEAVAAEASFGFRWFGIQTFADKPYLAWNDRRIVLRGVAVRAERCADGDSAGRTAMAVHRAGFNTVFLRGAAEALAPWLMACDRAGLCVVLCAGVEAARVTCDPICAELEALLRAGRNHACVTAYRAELTPGVDLAEDGARALERLHGVDPTRLLWVGSMAAAEKQCVQWSPFDPEPRVAGWREVVRWNSEDVSCAAAYTDPRTFERRSRESRAIVSLRERDQTQDDAPASCADDSTALDAWLAAQGGCDDWTGRTLPPAIHAVRMARVGRMIEHARMSNYVDLYETDAWDAHDDKHNSTAEAALVRANRPLGLVVRLRTPVSHVGRPMEVDVFLLNDGAFRGNYVLEITVTDAEGVERSQNRLPVRVQGTLTLGQLLVEGLHVGLPPRAGRYEVSARLCDALDGHCVGAEGMAALTMVDWKRMLRAPGGAILTSAEDPVRQFLARSKHVRLRDYAPAETNRFVVLSDFAPEPRQAIPPALLRTAANPQAPGVTFELLAGRAPESALLGHGTTHTIAADWGVAGPQAMLAEPPRLPLDGQVMARWHGWVHPSETGRYVIEAEGCGAVRASIAGRQALAGVLHGGTTRLTSAWVYLTAGEPAEIEVTLRPVGGEPERLSLRWSPPSSLAAHASLAESLLNAAREGATLLVLDHADAWARMFESAGCGRYLGSVAGGARCAMFNRRHAVFADLPAPCVFGAVYESFMRSGARRWGVRLEGGTALVGLLASQTSSAAASPSQTASALHLVPIGAGQVVYSTLDFQRAIPSHASAAEVARALLCNLVRFAAY